MSNERQIPTPQPSDLPTQQVLIGGSPINTEYKVASIDVTKVFNKVSYARLAIYDGDPAKGDFPVSNKDDFKPGNEIEIQAGYHSENKTIFKGVVVSHGVRVKKEKGYYLIVEARDKAIKLTGTRKSAYFYESKDSDIIEQLAQKAGLQKDIEATSVTHPEMVQYHATDWDFIVSRAEANALLLLTDDNKLIAKKPVVGNADLKLEFGATLMDFEADIDSTTQYKAVKSAAWDHSKQEVVESSGSNPSFNDNGNLKSDALASVLDVENLQLQHSGRFTEPELQNWTDGYILRNKLARVQGRAKFQGYADIKPGMTVELIGVGERFNGKAFVSGIRHQLNSANWTTDAQLGFSNSWFHKEPDISEPKASGLLPGVNGLHIGVVHKLQDDPLQEDRIQVKMPLVDNKGEGIWARVAMLDAGKERGTFFRPEVGDEVVLGFLNDDPRYPVVLGTLHSKNLPAPIKVEDTNHHKGIVTREKLKILFDDEKKIITVVTPGKQSIVIDDDKKSITITDANKNVMEMSDKGITIDSCADIKMKAKGEISMEAMTIKGKANTELAFEGATTAVKGSTQTTIKGAMVMIN